MKRLYYLFRGTQYAKNIKQDLINSGLEQSQMHFMSKDVAGLSTLDVPEADILQQTDIQHSGTYGTLIGAGVGVLFALYILTTELGDYMSLGLFLFICALFTFFGAWTGGMVGLSHDNHHVARFHDALEQGDTLLMLDAFDNQQESRMKQVMHTRHLEASYEGAEDNFKVFL